MGKAVLWAVLDIVSLYNTVDHKTCLFQLKYFFLTLYGGLHQSYLTQCYDEFNISSFNCHNIRSKKLELLHRYMMLNKGCVPLTYCSSIVYVFLIASKME